MWSRPNTLRRLSQKTLFYNSRVLERSQLHIPFLRVLGPFYSGEVLPPFLVEQASHPCRASLSSLQNKLLILVEQASPPCKTSFLKHGGQVWAFVLSGAHPKDGPYLLWACGHGPIGLVNGPTGLAKPLFHILSSSAAPFTPFDPSSLCERSIGVTVRTSNNDGPYSWG